MTLDKQSKRELIKNKILAGGVTREDLKTEFELNDRGIYNQFSLLRLQGFYPVETETGALMFVSKEEWDTRKQAAREARSAKRTPKQRLKLAERKLLRSDKTYARVYKMSQNNPGNRELAIRARILELKCELIEQEIKRLKEAVKD